MGMSSLSFYNYFFAVRFAVKREEKFRQTLQLATIGLAGAPSQWLV